MAVHHPINYSRATNDANALKRRILKYLVPVTVISILFNVTKFFEITYVYIPVGGGAINNNNLTPTGTNAKNYFAITDGDVNNADIWIYQWVILIALISLVQIDKMQAKIMHQKFAIIAGGCRRAV